jgi:hypothetical protein
MNRITTGLIAIVATLALLFVGTAPAEALVKRPISISAYAKGGHAHLKGHVGPGNTYQRRAVLIQRRICKAGKCAWHNTKTTRTNRHSNYDTAVPLPRRARWTYRAVVKASGGYAWSSSKALTIFWT